MTVYFSRETWFSLPKEMRLQWWRDTDYGRMPPTRAMCETLAKECSLVITGPCRENADSPLVDHVRQAK